MLALPAILPAKCANLPAAKSVGKPESRTRESGPDLMSFARP
jgi:hypothetical protein